MTDRQKDYFMVMLDLDGDGKVTYEELLAVIKDTRAAGVNNTWGRRCNILLYMTTEHVADLNTVNLKLWGPEGRNMLWTKSKMAWLHVYNNRCV